MTTTHLTLAEGDSDAELRWGGGTAPDAEPLHMEALVAPNDDGRTGNTLVQPTPVRQLQLNLIDLGFTFVRRASPGVMDRLTRWGVREFQIYARMPIVAQQARPIASGGRYVDTLQSVRLTRPYNGPVSGVANPATHQAIQHWLRYNLRCPVVVSAYTEAAPGRPARVASENIWLHDEVKDAGVRMFARDFSGYYTLPPGRDPNGLIAVGKHQDDPGTDFFGPISGPPRSCWQEAEILPEALLGVPMARLSATQLSTFKVVRALSEVECYGYADCFNAWDRAFISLGPCHWTLGLISSRGVDAGELGGFMAYLRERYPADYHRAIGYFGVQPGARWGGSGRPLFDRGLRKYATWVDVEQEGGTTGPLPKTEAEGNWFRSWHWFYRLLMAARTIPNFRRAMWDMTRVRLRDIADTPWSTGDGASSAKIGDIFTSERALGIILRWHVFLPAYMVSGGQAGSRLRNALAAATHSAPGLGWSTAPSTWTDAHERALLSALRAEYRSFPNESLRETAEIVDRWHSVNPPPVGRGYRLPRIAGGLGEARRSFVLDRTGLPAPPF